MTYRANVYGSFTEVAVETSTTSKRGKPVRGAVASQVVTIIFLLVKLKEKVITTLELEVFE